ncbi:MAG: outer membrane beta-barrel protein [Paludibacter sp.]|nr:outer membrane beta-barrel protein [Paludibacter sp.]
MKHLFLFLVLFFSLTSFSQHSIQTSVFDSKNGLPIELGTVRLLKSSDSTMVQGCQTDTKGGFLLSKIKNGNYILKVSSVGYLEYRKNINMVDRDIILKNIQLEENVQLLKEVKVTGTAAQLVMKGDTMEYNATAFKTDENAVVEDLLKRLPGVEISSEGKITVNGEEIKKIRVDGKKFFNDDVEMTTKNLPADMIDKIQVLDQKSDMALLTGFEDDDTERIINLTTKSNRKKGVFGNVTTGGGVDTDKEFRYDSNAFVNVMDGDAQTAVTGGANNVNNVRSSRGRFGGGGGSNSGITTTQNLGLNNNTIVNPKLKVGGNVAFNHSENDAQTLSEKESYLLGLKYNNSDSTTSLSNNYSTNLRLEMEWKPDSINTFIFQPNMSYSRSFSDSQRNYLYLTENDSTSWGNSSNIGDGSGIDAGLNVIYNRKFAKKGRTFTAELGGGLSNSESESLNQSNKYTINNVTTNIDQKTFNTSTKFNYNIELSFVEPLWNVKNLLETNVTLRNTTTNSVKDQYKNDGFGNYTQLDSVYSNTFDNIFYRETIELNYRYTEKNYYLRLGLRGEPSQTNNVRYYGDGISRDTTYGVFNFAPRGRFQYNFNKKKFARVDYTGRTSQPSINQMQPVKNNSDPMHETVGNANLNPSFSHSFRMFYSSFNDQTFSSFSTRFSAEATNNDLVSNSIYDTTGKEYSQTVNATAVPYSFDGNVMFNTPLIQKRLHFNTSTSGGYDMRYGYSSTGYSGDINTESLVLGDLSSTRRYTATERLSLTFTHDVVEVGVKGAVQYSNTKNNLNPIIAETWDWTGSGNLVLHLPYKYNISSDINYTTRQGYSNFDQNELIWNASINKTMFSNKGVLSLKWNDILRQQLNIRQTIGDNYIQYSKYNTLTSYFMLTFSYKINKFKGASTNPAEKNPDDRMDGDRPHRGDGSGGGGGGGRRPE